MTTTPAERPARAPSHVFCHACGTAYANLTWPRQCRSCGERTFESPLAVAVCATPVWSEEAGLLGFLGVQRGLRDGYGQWAFPGGFAEKGESFEAAALREEWEETRIKRQHARLVMSLPTANLPTLVFSLTEPLHVRDLALAVPQAGEILDVGVLKRGQPLAYPLHEQALEALWIEGQIASHHAILALS